MPKIFFLQLNRLKFEGGIPEKVRSECKLEKIIYPDRFLIKNKEQSEKTRVIVNQMRNIVRYLEKCLLEYEQFDKTDYNLQKCLELVTAFFTKQGEGENVDTSSGVQAFLPLKQQQHAQDSVISTLKQYTSEVS